MNIKLATFELTNSCNLQCLHCYLPKDKQEGDLSKWQEIISNLADYGVEKIILTGGEPLLFKQFIELYQYIHNKGLKVSLFTNGILINKHIDLFRSFPPESISITLYGSDQTRYHSFSKKDVFDKVMKNINLLEENGIKIYKGFTLSVYDDDQQTINFIKNNNIYINTYLMPTLDGKDNKELRLDNNKIIFIEKNIGRKFQPTPTLTCDSDIYNRKCAGGLSSIYIDQQYNVSMCAMNRNLQLNFFDFDLQNIFHHLHQEHLKIKDRYFNSKCGVCEFNQQCRNCPIYTDLEQESDGNSYLCSLMNARKRD